MAPSMVILALLPPVAVFLGSPGGTVTVTVLAAIGVPFQDGHHDETEKRDLVSDGDDPVWDWGVQADLPDRSRGRR